ncbi:UvrD-helicase domain-containing protein [Levilinea saccharolytica]|uniref:UvrD-like helicase ATP-binding domain-containing protein n=1 Tax=Levilinea saccharolytica TaxID=229921 RepID=A0A0P6YDL1_9CHLR|nr:UvrD-helicase domain-containing protein [Levilinea saccharolytica]KPL80094.1 hypothetical protein ADN01_12570 [Levilinea saccharolytica]GAP17736.1 superfamily I DNA and RNA helicase [Levilinea saccharolytica]
MFNLSPAQQALVDQPFSQRIWLEGPPGTGKTTAAVARLRAALENGIPGDSILVLAPLRTLAQPYTTAVRDPALPSGSPVTIVTLGGLAQRNIDLFWPYVAESAGFSHPELPPTFLTLETAQYYLAHVIQPLLEENFFDSIRLDTNRLYSQVLDNLNKAALVGFEVNTIAERLKSASLGKPAELHLYEQAQECALRFRQYCLENNLLDFSLQMEIFQKLLWPHPAVRAHLSAQYRHLFYENVEEDAPVVHDIVSSWLGEFESALLVYDRGGGYRAFLGADPLSAEQLNPACDQEIFFNDSWVVSPAVEALRATLEASVRQQDFSASPLIPEALEFNFSRFMPQSADWIAEQIRALVQEQDVPPEEIVVLAPFLSDGLRFALSQRLQAAGIPVRSHRPSRSLRAENATQCLLTLAVLAHPAWGLTPRELEVRSALQQAVEGLDLPRAHLLYSITFRKNAWNGPGFTSFEKIQPEMQERITFEVGRRFEHLRGWLMNYLGGPPVELDVFISRLFGEVLSQPGFGFHNSFDNAAVTARLIESIRKFRLAAGAALQDSGRSVGQEYVEMVAQGLIAAQYTQEWQDDSAGAVLLAPAFTFLMMNRPVRFQFWVDVGSRGWFERLYQPLTHPLVLSRRWTPGKVWTDADEEINNRQTLARLTNGLLLRCRERIALSVNAINEQGSEQRGPLLFAFQRIFRRQAEAEGGGRV